MLSDRPEGKRDSTELRCSGRAGWSVRRVACCRYIEQVAVALRGRERAVETIQALLRSCRAKTVSSAAAMHQVDGRSFAADSCYL